MLILWVKALALWDGWKGLFFPQQNLLSLLNVWVTFFPLTTATTFHAILFLVVLIYAVFLTAQPCTQLHSAIFQLIGSSLRSAQRRSLAGEKSHHELAILILIMTLPILLQPNQLTYLNAFTIMNLIMNLVWLSHLTLVIRWPLARWRFLLSSFFYPTLLLIPLRQLSLPFFISLLLSHYRAMTSSLLPILYWSTLVVFF